MFPRRVAFVQCVGSREEGIGADYCSTTCCTDALELASRLREKLGDIELTIYHRGMRPIGRRGERLFRQAEHGDGPALVMAMVTGVSGPGGDGPVTVTYDRGSGDAEEEFDLVVLSTGRSASGATRGAARQVRADTNKFGFVSVDPLSAPASSAERVLAAGSCVRPVDPLTAGQAGAATAAVASRSEDYLNAPAPEGGAETGTLGSAPGDGPVVVCVCEQGLSVTGLSPGELVREIGRIDGVTLSVSLGLACGPESLGRLRDLAGGLSGARVVVAGCYPATHSAILGERFARRLPSAASVGVVGVGSGESAAAVASRVSERLAGGAESARAERPAPAGRVLVAGGGPAGLTAAEEVAAHGIPVTIVESSGSLGGDVPPELAGDPEAAERWKALPESVASNSLIDVHLETTVSGFTPAERGFRASAGGTGSLPNEVHGALIVATGAAEHDPNVGRSGRQSGSVMTQAELAASLAAGGERRGEVVMLQCVGSRNDQRPYCSRTCCAAALRNALALKQEDPVCKVTILHRGIRVWGFDEELLSEAIDQGVEFIEVESTPEVIIGGAPQGAPAGAAGETEEGGAAASTSPGVPPYVKGTAIDGSALALNPDLVVLSTGIEPSDGTGALAEAAGLKLSSDGFFERAGVVAGDPGGFRVYVCGRASGPADLHERILQARAAAGKACLYLKRGSDEA
jgi:heterodisulfide reductase subunit A-like polyferredoxin